MKDCCEDRVKERVSSPLKGEKLTLFLFSSPLRGIYHFPHLPSLEGRGLRGG